MSSTYADWRLAYVAGAGHPRLQAHLAILEAETRVPIAHAQFRGLLVTAFDDELAKGSSPAQAAHQALANAVRTASADPAYTFLLPMPSTRYGDAVTHVTARYLSRFSTAGDIDTDAGAPPRLSMMFVDAFAPPKTTIWLSPDDCPELPDDVARDLGLPHFEGHVAYRVRLAVDTSTQFIPTCFDAGLFEAWQEPPLLHPGPCGVTRHVETGQRIHNEFVVRTLDVSDQDISLKRLPTTGPTTRVGPLHPDYLVNR